MHIVGKLVHYFHHHIHGHLVTATKLAQHRFGSAYWDYCAAACTLTSPQIEVPDPAAAARYLPYPQRDPGLQGGGEV